MVHVLPLIIVYFIHVSVMSCLRTLDGVIWVTIPLSFVTVMTFDIAFNLRDLIGDDTKAVHLVSYSTFIFQLYAIPTMCLVARLNICRHRILEKPESPILGLKYIIETMKYLSFSRLISSQYIAFSLLAVWPIINGLLVIYIFVETDDVNCFLNVYIVSRVTTVLVFLQYACFSFLFYILRKAFTARLKTISDGIGNFQEDKCKAELCQAYLEYRSFRNLVGGWMTFVLAVGVLGVTTQLSYYYYSHQSDHPTQNEAKMTRYSMMIWSEKLMFLLQPMFVFGGINVDYLWRDLKRRVTKKLGTQETVAHLKNIIQHMDIINISPRWIVPTLGFSLASFYLGFHLPSQNLQFWYGVCAPDTTNSSEMSL